MQVVESSGPVRVGLLGCVDLLGDLIRSVLAGRIGLQIVADVPGDSLALALLHRPDVVIWQSSPGTRPGDDPFVDVCPPAVVAVYDDGRSGAVWRLRPTREELGDLSPESLGDAVALAGREGQRS
ncbi:hypothetical protein AB0H36_41735 [Kribbella sp. NPDC050820]|uniref:hypothetical protein n=1 Tax=Kribbella sp. NPDC050820 TaxID=3155408 RepID=UPI0033C759F5